MANTRTAEKRKQHAISNRKQLDAAIKAQMEGRKVSDGFRKSRLNEYFLFNKDEVILYVVGSAPTRTIFIEKYDRSFETYSIDVLQDIKDNTPLDDFTTPFYHDHPSLFEARSQFIQKGSYYFGCCVPINAVKVPKEMSDDFVPFNEVDAIIHTFICGAASALPSSADLALFDKEYAFNISDIQSKYDKWLEEWNKPLNLDFFQVTDEDARKVLQLLQCYLSGGKAKRFLFGKWHHHYCNEIESVLSNHDRREKLDNNAPIIEATVMFNRTESFSVSEAGELLSGGIELIPLHSNSATVSVK